jgi:hypothetical protein
MLDCLPDALHDIADHVKFQQGTQVLFKVLLKVALLTKLEDQVVVILCH